MSVDKAPYGQPYQGSDAYGGMYYDPSMYAPAQPGRDPYLAFALRWWWLLLLGFVIGVAGAFAYTQYGPVSYESVALVQVPQQSSLDPTANAGQVRDATKNFLAEATSSHMLSLVGTALKDKVTITSTDWTRMLEEERLKVSQIRDANFIRISVTDSDPEKARLIASTMSTVFVAEVNNRSGRQLQASQVRLQEQIDTTRQRLITSQMRRRESELRAEITAVTTRLLELQASYEQELQRQAESDRSAGAADATRLQEIRERWLTLVSQQITDAETNISQLNQELQKVQADLALLPDNADPAVSAALADAYAHQLTELAAQLADLQLLEQGAIAPLIVYGDASEPLLLDTGKILFVMGAAGGFALFGMLGLAIDLRRSRRKSQIEESSVSEPELDALLGKLERLGLTDNAAAIPTVRPETA